MSRQPKPSMRVSIKPEIYLKDQVPQDDLISKLAPELTEMVWHAIDRDIDKTCFALTCKANAQVYSNRRLDRDRRQCTSPELRINLLQRLRGFADLNRFRLCFGCGQYKTRKGNWRGMSAYARMRKVTRAQRVKGPNCPVCVEKAIHLVKCARTTLVDMR